MDFYDIDYVKLEKANAIKRHNQLQKISNFFRIFEICVVLILLSWFSTHLPTIIQISGNYFRNLCLLIISPRFVFVIGNVIILTLFVKSGQFSGEESSMNNGEKHSYDDFVKKSEMKQSSCTFMVKEEIGCEDKKIENDKNTVRDTVINTDTAEERPKVYRRSRSETRRKVETEEKPRRELRRSKTEKCRRESDTHGEKPVAGKESSSDTFMSNEEFRRRIEKFIAKQVSFHREESMAIVLQ